jgi:hypothetical protein
MAKKRKEKDALPVVCGACMEPVDKKALLNALEGHEAYVHDCGRVLLAKR